MTSAAWFKKKVRGWLQLVGCCWLVVVRWLLLAGCCWLLLVVVGCCCWLLLVVVGCCCCCCCCIGRGEAANNPIDSSRTRKRLFFGQSVKFCASNFEKLDVRYGKSLSELWSCGRSLSNEGRWIARNVLQRFETDTVYKVKCQQEHALKILRLIYTYFTLAWLRGTLYTKKNLHQASFTPEDPYTRNRVPCTPKTFCLEAFKFKPKTRKFYAKNTVHRTT